MKKDAEANAEADKKAKDEVDKYNSADQMIFQTEKQLKEFGDKLSKENKSNIESSLAKEITKTINIPTIGIGAGQDCDGQVLVLHDMLGITTDFSPRFLRRYLDLENQITGAVQQYCDDVRSGDFPNQEESY